MAVYVRSLSDRAQHCFSKISVTEDTSCIDGVYEPPLPERKHKIVGHCKGLYCLEYENGRSVVWNPSKNEFKFLPPSELKIPRCPYPNCATIDCNVRTTSGIRGLGFDPKSGDYKVARLAANFYDHCKDCRCIKQVEVYSLRHDCWEEIGAEGEQYHLVDECATYADGCCYWIAQTEVGLPTELIISLDLSSHEFSTVGLPIGGGFGFREYGSILTECEKSLALIVYMRWGRGGRMDKPMFCWVRGITNEGQPLWVEKMNFKFHGAEKPLGFCGDFLLFEGFDCGLLIYDSEQKLFRKIVGIHDYPHCMHLCPFAKSKVSLASFDTDTREGKSKWSLIPHKVSRKEMLKRKRKGKSKKEGDDEE